MLKQTRRLPDRKFIPQLVSTLFALHRKNKPSTSYLSELSSFNHLQWLYCPVRAEYRLSLSLQIIRALRADLNQDFIMANPNHIIFYLLYVMTCRRKASRLHLNRAMRTPCVCKCSENNFTDKPRRWKITVDEPTWE